MAETKTRETEASVDAFIDAVEPERRREDARVLRDLMTEITAEPARMWGPTMIGFGRYHYRYDSGHEGDAMRIGFSPRKASLVLYVLADFAECEDLLARLGKHRTGKSCLYVNKLADVDMDVLRTLTTASWRHMHERYPG